MVWKRYTDLFSDAMLVARFSQSAVADPLPAPRGLCEVCDICGHTSSTVALLMSHKYQVHGYRQPARYFCDGSICRGCATDHHTRARLIKHLAYASSKCLNAIMLRVDPITDEQVLQLDEAQATEARQLLRRGLGPTWADRPPRRIVGCSLV